ncbi:MAG: recombinase family protein [Spirochaetales bacterium]
MNAVIYARYSSERQTEQSIEGQMRVCKEYAKKQGYTIVNEYIDRAISGKTSQRPSFLKMISDAEEGNFEAVIVYKLDRFARNRYDSVVYKHRLKEFGVRVDSAMEQITDSAEGILVEGLLETMAELYSHDLSQKVKRGMNESFLKKQFLGGGIPVGYKIVDKKVKIDEQTAEAVKFMFESFANGMSKTDLAKELNKRGIKTGRGHTFTRKNFYSIFTNKRYIGIHAYNGQECRETFPAIIDIKTFEKVQHILKSKAYNKGDSDKKVLRMDYPLVQKVFCGMCGSKMTGISGTSHTKERHYYYCCANARKRVKPKLCTKSSERKNLLEDLVVVLTKGKLYNKETLMKFATAIYENNQNGKVVQTINHLNTSINQINKKIEKTVNLFINASDNEELLNQLKEKHREFTQEKKDYEKELLKYKLLNENNSNKSIEEIYQTLKEIYDAKISTAKDRKEYFNKYVNSVYVFEEIIVIYYNYDEKSKMVSYQEMLKSLSNLEKQPNEIIYKKSKNIKEVEENLDITSVLQAVFFNENTGKQASSKVLQKEKSGYH